MVSLSRIIESDLMLPVVAALTFYGSMTLSGPGVLRGGLLLVVGGCLMYSIENEF